MRIGVGLSIPELATRGGRFSPASLFTSGVQGAWYDPSDVLLNWRTNLLEQTQAFENAYWSKTGVGTLTADADTGADGTLTADVATANALLFRVFRNGLTLSAGQYTFSIWLRRQSGSAQYEISIDGITFTNITVTSTLTRFSLTATVAAGPSYPQVRAQNATTSDTLTLWGAQLEFGSTATTYQAITTPEQTYLTYDPQPVLFQDSAGTTPVTAVEQPVGLMLDKSQGLVLGPELVTNGDFATSSDWTLGSGWTISGGAAVATSAASGATVIQIQTEFVSGRLYKFTYTVVSVSAGGFSARFEGQTGTSRTTPGTYTEYFFSTGATQNSGVRANGTTTGSITNISVKELPGNHASQATAASRPVLRARKNWLVGTNTLATQTVTTRAIPYVLSFYGTGSITLSGTATGTLNGTGVNDRVYVDVTPTAGTLTVTVTGTVTNAQLEFANEPA